MFDVVLTGLLQRRRAVVRGCIARAGKRVGCGLRLEEVGPIWFGGVEACDCVGSVYEVGDQGMNVTGWFVSSFCMVRTRRLMCGLDYEMSTKRKGKVYTSSLLLCQL